MPRAIRRRFFPVAVASRVVLAGLVLLGAASVASAAGSLPEFVATTGAQSHTPRALFRYDTAGQPDSAPAYPGTGLVLPDSTVSVAWGPDGNLYRLDLAGAVQKLDLATYALTPFVAAAPAEQRFSITFGPGGALYIQTLLQEIHLFCGPLATACTPGQPIGPQDGFYASALGFDLFFGPDKNVYSVSASEVQRHCASGNPCGADGAAFGYGGNTSDARYVSFPNANFKNAAFGPDGNLYIIDAAQGILRYCGPGKGAACPEGQADPAPGQSGSVFVPYGTAGWFSDSSVGIDFGPDGKIYVTNILYIFRFNGPLCAPQPTCQGAPDGLPPYPGAIVFTNESYARLRFAHPSSLVQATAALGSYSLFVGDIGVNSILRYDLNLKPRPAATQSGATLVPANSEGLDMPTGIAVGSDGNVYVASYNTDSILRFSADTGVAVPGPTQSGATFVATSYAGLSGPKGIAIGPDGNLFVSNHNGNNVLRFDGSTGAALPAANRSGAEFVAAQSGGLSHPNGLAFGPDGNVYVASPDGPGRVYRFNGQTGDFIDVFADNVVPNPNSNFTPFYPPEGVGFEQGQLLVNVASLAGYDWVTGNFEGVGDTNVYLGAGGVAGLGTGAFYTGINGPYIEIDGVGVQAAVGSNQPFYVAVQTLGTPGLSGKVYKDAVAPANVLEGAQVQAAQEFVPGLFTCPIGGLIFAPCPSAMTDAQGSYSLAGVQSGTLLLTAWPDAFTTPGYFPNSIVMQLPPGASGTVSAPDLVVLPPAVLPPDTGVSPSTSVAVTGGDVPVVTWNTQFTISTKGCAGATSARFTLTDAAGNILVPAGTRSDAMTEAPSSTYTGTVDPLNPFKGALTVSITITCPGGATETSGFLLYVDPSGTVVDLFDNAPIPAATVTLFRSDSPYGPFTQVPDGSSVMAPSNRHNPDQTNALGAYGWDVYKGYYQLEASAPGYTCNAIKPPHGYTCDGNSVRTGVLAVPPAVTDLKLPLRSDALIFFDSFEREP